MRRPVIMARYDFRITQVINVRDFKMLYTRHANHRFPLAIRLMVFSTNFKEMIYYNRLLLGI